MQSTFAVAVTIALLPFHRNGDRHTSVSPSTSILAPPAVPLGLGEEKGLGARPLSPAPSGSRSANALLAQGPRTPPAGAPGHHRSPVGAQGPSAPVLPTAMLPHLTSPGHLVAFCLFLPPTDTPSRALCCPWGGEVGCPRQDAVSSSECDSGCALGWWHGPLPVNNNWKPWGKPTPGA